MIYLVSENFLVWLYILRLFSHLIMHIKMYLHKFLLLSLFIFLLYGTSSLI